MKTSPFLALSRHCYIFSSNLWIWEKLCLCFSSIQQVFHFHVIIITSWGSWCSYRLSVLLVFSKSLQMSCFGNMGILWERNKTRGGCVNMCETNIIRICARVCERKRGWQEIDARIVDSQKHTLRVCVHILQPDGVHVCMWECVSVRVKRY